MPIVYTTPSNIKLHILRYTSGNYFFNLNETQ